MNVLVIPEDFPLDQHILKPMIAAMPRHLGQPRAKVQMCVEPRLRGVDEALRWERILEILKQYWGTTDLFLLLVDRDGNATREQRLRSIEQQSRAFLADDRVLFAENAWQEIEVWVLAGHTLPKGWSWKEIRAEIHPKERYFEPFARQLGVHGGLGGGRKALAEKAASKYQRVRRLCPEDVARLESQIASWLSRQT